MANLRISLLILLSTIAVGVAGYTLIERWNPLDSLYMTMITLATVGYGETHPLSQQGRIFTMGLIVVGRAAEIFVVVNFTQVLVVEHLSGAFQRRRMQQEIDRLSDHYLICGWGRMGQEIAEQFQAKEVPFVVVDMSAAKCDQLREQRIHAVQGDAADDRVLKQAGIERARGLIAVAPGDADNVFITLSARALNPNLHIVARCAYEQDIQKLRTAGCNRVISPYVIGAHRIASAAFQPAVVDFLDQELHAEGMEWDLEEIPVSKITSFAGKMLRDSGIREQTGCTILAIRDGATRAFNNNPPPDAILRPGDTLIVLGMPEQLEAIEKLAGVSGVKRIRQIVP